MVELHTYIWYIYGNLKSKILAIIYSNIAYKKRVLCYFFFFYLNICLKKNSRFNIL